MQILNIHTSRMRTHQLLASDVDIIELAVETKNFSGAELEGLVRAAQSTAMNRHIKVCSSLALPNLQIALDLNLDPASLCCFLFCSYEFCLVIKNSRVNPKRQNKSLNDQYFPPFLIQIGCGGRKLTSKNSFQG